MVTTARKPTKKQVDALIEQTYTQSCQNVQIPMMQIPEIFKVGYKALAEGRDLKQAIVDFVETIRVDKKSA